MKLTNSVYALPEIFRDLQKESNALHALAYSSLGKEYLLDILQGFCFARKPLTGVSVELQLLPNDQYGCYRLIASEKFTIHHTDLPFLVAISHDNMTLSKLTNYGSSIDKIYALSLPMKIGRIQDLQNILKIESIDRNSSPTRPINFQCSMLNDSQMKAVLPNQYFTPDDFSRLSIVQMDPQAPAEQFEITALRHN